jgi:hypothetical protein
MASSNSIRFSLVTALLAALLPACGSDIVAGGVYGNAAPGPGPGPGPGPDAPGTAPSAAQDLAYPGTGFVVHEWGTDTVVVGSDGSLQRGLHHEEEDLPAFVYDRIKAGSIAGSTSVHVKMETPVLYFYADKPVTASVSVGFPAGVLTQWYPAVKSFYPLIAGPNAAPGATTYMDPALDIHFPFGSEMCREKFGGVENGLLDWGKVEILPRGTLAKAPDAPLDKFTWSFAREVDANAVRIAPSPGGAPEAQEERFLFYRGLGNFDLTTQVRALPGQKLTVTNASKLPVGAVFVVNVGKASGAFLAKREGIPGGGSIEVATPALDKALALDAFVEELGASVTEALDGEGLYHDEALAMVNTWKRQWFRTPGVRVLYLMPEAWTNGSIPLSIEPKPDAIKRVMMIRTEVITPELEEVDVKAALELEKPETAEAAKEHFRALGRFAEPRLRRALSLLGDPAFGAALLAEVESADTSDAAGE